VGDVGHGSLCNRSHGSPFSALTALRWSLRVQASTTHSITAALGALRITRLQHITLLTSCTRCESSVTLDCQSVHSRMCFAQPPWQPSQQQQLDQVTVLQRGRVYARQTSVHDLMLSYVLTSDMDIVPMMSRLLDTAAQSLFMFNCICMYVDVWFASVRPK